MNGFALCMKDNKFGIINKKGHLKVAGLDKIAQGNQSLYAFSRNNFWGFITADGRETVIPYFTSVGDFKNGLAMVQLDKKFGYINQKGDVVIPIIYESAQDFSNGMASVKLRGIYYFLDENGHEKLALSLDGRSVSERIIVKVNQNELLYHNGELVTASIK